MKLLPILTKCNIVCTLIENGTEQVYFTGIV